MQSYKTVTARVSGYLGQQESQFTIKCYDICFSWFTDDFLNSFTEENGQNIFLFNW